MNGWNASLQFPWALCSEGARTFVIHVETRQIVSEEENAYPAGWLSRGVYLFTRGHDEREIWSRHVETGARTKIADAFYTEDGVRGDGRGHAVAVTTRGLWVYLGGVWMKVDARSFFYQSVAVRSGNGLIAAVDRATLETVVFRLDDARWHETTYAPGPTGNLRFASERGVVHGYNGPVMLQPPDGPEVDITVTPWRQESPALYLGRGLWARSTWFPVRNKGYVLITDEARPGVAVHRGDMPVSHLDAELLPDGRVALAGNDARGAFYSAVVPVTTAPFFVIADDPANPVPVPTPPSPDPKPDPVLPPKITIDAWGPKKGRAPLTVTLHVVAEPGAGPIGAVRVEAVGPVKVTGGRSGPGYVDLAFTEPGEYRIKAFSVGPGGAWVTGRSRILTVEAAEPPVPTPEPVPVPSWDDLLREAETLPAGTSLRYAVAYGRLRAYGGPEAVTLSPLTQAEAFAFLWPGQAAPGPVPGPDPVPPGPVRLPSREEAYAAPGAIALTREIFSPFLFAQPEATRQAWYAAFRAAGLRRLIVMLSGEYRGRFPWFWLWDDVPAIRRLLTEVIAEGFVPLLWAANGESFRARQLAADATDILSRSLSWDTVPSGDVIDDDEGRLVVARSGISLNTFLTGPQGFLGPRASMARALGDPLEATWRRVLPAIADLVPMAVPAPEMNDIWTPQQQHDRTVLLHELMSQTAIGVHFTRGRCHGDHNRGTGPDGQPPAAWKPEDDPNNPGKQKAGVVGYYSGSPVHFNFYNAPYDHLGDVRRFMDDLGDVAVRVDGRVLVPGKSAPYPGMRRVVIYGEGPAEWVLRGDWSWSRGEDLRRAASVPWLSAPND